MKSTAVLKIIAILWLIWGLVHAFAGIMIISSDTTGAIQAIADGVEPATLVMDYPPAAGGIINQHGFNLLWIGLVTTIGCFFIWQGSFTFLWLSALVGGLADLGYFLFIDLGGFNNFVPGTVMTLISGGAILLSIWAVRAAGVDSQLA